MYTLYYSPSTASMTVHWMLIELAVPFELVLVDFETKAQKSPEFLRVNPSGHVPVLVIDDVPYTECAAQMMLLAERHPAANLSPVVGTAERSSYLQTMFYLANTLQPAYRSWFYPEEAAGVDNIDAAKIQARTKIELVWARLDAKFEDGRRFLLGKNLTAADFLATILMRWSRNMPRPATEFPNLAAYIGRMRAMPSLREVHLREKLTDWIDG
ncbi:MAG: glutathione S-transferase family protein [Rhizomicrobium sp.]|jgi:glutathione S-transferase